MLAEVMQELRQPVQGDLQASTAQLSSEQCYACALAQQQLGKILCMLGLTVQPR
jgi:hypothetical protein